MPDNKQRALCAGLALDAYRRAKYDTHAEADEADTRDLITDLLHLIKQESGTAAVFDELHMALGNFAEESNTSAPIIHQPEEDE